MRKLFKLNEKDLGMIAGGISSAVLDIIFGIVHGIPEGVPIVTTVQKMRGNKNVPSTSTIVTNGITAAFSSVVLMGVGAGTLKVGQVLYNKLKGQKV